MRLRLLAFVLLSGAAFAARAGEVQVAVAANFAAPMAGIARGFTAATGHTVRLTPGATGKFRAQVEAGAPFDVLLAADAETPAKLLASGRAVPGTAFTYALGRLVLWSATPGLVDGQGAVLDGGRFRHLAIANPRLAPYGEAAQQVLRARGQGRQLADRLVVGESIAQAFQFVASGNAELGFVALSQVRVPGKPPAGSMWRVPESLYAPIRQDAVLLKPGEANPAARALLDWLRGPQARGEIEAWGYALSPEPVK